MNRVFEYNGTFVSPSNPGKGVLKKVKRNLIIDSADRDLVKYEKNGEFTIYLPKVYENVIAIRLAAAEFPNLDDAIVYDRSTGGTGVAITHGGAIAPTYFLIELIGMNKSDECAINANRSGYLDGFFAKIANPGVAGNILYNDHSAQDNIANYSPPIGKLDRLQIKIRDHSQQGNSGYIYWATDFSLSLELEFIENNFDIFSSFETRIADRELSTA
jgi:hypothetical protein